jgi:hypothetical protein
VTTTGSFTVNNAASVVSLGTGTFTVGAMGVSAGSFTQTGNNGANTQSLASLAVSGAATTCSWDSGLAGGTLAVAGSAGVVLNHAAGSLSFGQKTFNSGTGTLRSGGTSIYNLTLSGATDLADALAVGNTLSLPAGTLDVTASNFGVTVTGNWSNAGGTFTARNGTVTLNGTSQTLVAGASPFYNLTLTNTTTTVNTDALTVTGTLSIGATTTLDMTDRGFTVNVLSNANILELDGSQAVQVVTTPDTDSGTVLFNGATGGNFVGTAGFHDYYDIQINSGGQTFNLGNAIVVNRDLTITAGTLDVTAANNYAISVGRNWTLVGGFNCQAGTVTFTPNAYTGGTFRITGATTWYNLSLNVVGIAGLRMEFERNRTQTFLGGGVFFVHADNFADRVVLTRNDLGDFGDDLDWVPPAAPNPTLMWQLFRNSLPSNAITDFQYVQLYYSDARATPSTYDSLTTSLGVVVPDGLPVGEVGDTCYGWQGGISALYSYTEDSDLNGKIDRIRVTANDLLDGNFGASAAQFDISVAGYTIDRTKGTRGFQLDADASTFFINLVEKPYTDGNATPAWTLVANATLKGSSPPFYTMTTLNTPMTPTDTVRPLIAYTLAIPGNDQVYFGFSEPVYNGAAALISSADLGLFPGATSIAQVGSTSQDFGVVSTEAAPISADDIASGLVDRSVGAAINDNASPANDVSALWAVAPNYTISTPPNAILATTHRVSDIMISVWPSSTPTSWSALHPNSWFVWPIYAKDKVTTTLTDAEIEALTPLQAENQGVGLVRAFDGTQWLRDQDWKLQARVNAGVAGLGAPTVFYDANVATSYIGSASGLWLPAHLETSFSGVDGFPNGGTKDDAGTSIGAGLYNWTFDAIDPKVFSVAKFDFWFQLSGAPGNLYAGRLEMAQGAAALPANWYRLVRPFSLDIHDVVLQRGSVTILNNVIDPTKGETVRLSYTIGTAGPTTITVFTLDGDVVKRLYSGTSAMGDYSVSWDGKNLSGANVARGVYFIRVVAPGIDEIRKVLVIRK